MKIDIRLSDSSISSILLVLESFFLFCRYIKAILFEISQRITLIINNINTKSIKE